MLPKVEHLLQSHACVVFPFTQSLDFNHLKSLASTEKFMERSLTEIKAHGFFMPAKSFHSRFSLRSSQSQKITLSRLIYFHVVFFFCVHLGITCCKNEQELKCRQVEQERP